MVTRAEWGERPSSEPLDVTDVVRAEITDNRLSLTPSDLSLGDPGGAGPRRLRVTYARDGFPTTVTVDDVQALELPGHLDILAADYGVPGQEMLDVRKVVIAMQGRDGVTIDIENAEFTDPDPNVLKELVIDYEVDGERHTRTVAEHGVITLPGELTIVQALYGEIPVNEPLDVTSDIADLVSEGRLTFVAGEYGGMAVPPEREGGGPRSLWVEYELDGETRTVTAPEGEQVTLAPPRLSDEPSDVYKSYLVPAPASAADFADRLSEKGLTAADFAPRDTDASLGDLVNGWLNLAPNARLDPLAVDPDAMGEPAEGVILHHEQGWYGRGLALGNLLHSVALAPGEVTQVAMTHWNHVTRSTDSESVSQDDSTDESDAQNRAVNEIQDATLHEHQHGSTAASSSTTSTSHGRSDTGAYLDLGLFGTARAGLSGTSDSSNTTGTAATTVTRTNNTRDLAMSSNQNIAASTKRHAEAARNRRATVIREVTQSEDETLTTRVVANYNHMHALTVMYFEVVEVYSLKTRVVDAERVVFLPYQVREVVELIPRFRATLVDAARAIGQPAMALAIHHYRAVGSNVTPLDKADLSLGTRRDALTKSLADLDAKAASADEASSRTRSGLESQMTRLSNRRNAILTQMSAFRELSQVLAGVAAEATDAQLQPLDRRLEEVRAQLQAEESSQEQRVRRTNGERAELRRTLDAVEAGLRLYQQAKTLLDDLETASPSGLFRDNRLYFNQAVWLHLSPGEVLGLARRRDTFQGEPLDELIDPEPVAVTGNYVGYRWNFAEPSERDAFTMRFVHPYSHEEDADLTTVQADVAVPTGGVFGEAVLGDAVSAEKIDLSRFWNWKDSMIPILPTAIKPLSAVAPTLQDLSAEPGSLDPSSATLGQLQALPDPSGFSALASTMQAQVFRDVSGQGMLQSLAEATTKAAESGDQHAATTASANLKAGLDFVSDMAQKAMDAAEAVATDGGSLMGDMVKKKDGGGASLLGGVLNAEKDAGKGSLLSKMTGGSGKGAEKEVAEAVEEGAEAGEGTDPEDGDTEPSGGDGDGSDPGEGEGALTPGDALPPSEVEEWEQ